MADFIPETEKRLGVDNRHERILLVSHAALVIALSVALVGSEAKDIRVGCASLSEFARREGGWRADRLADASHLTKGVERDWGLQDIVMDHGEVRFVSNSSFEI
jgi:transcription factor C subunit 7